MDNSLIDKNSGNGIPAPEVSTNGLVAYYDFDGSPDSTIVQDISGSGNNGTINGAKWDIGKVGDIYHGGDVYYYHGDHLGSSSVITNSTGDKVEESKYYPFGGIIEGGDEKYLYTGKELDKATNLYYYEARYYSHDIGRFVQPDNILPATYYPQALNRYTYVYNNPLKYRDPTGHYVESLIDAGFIAYDVNEIKKEPDNPWNYVALGADLACLALPLATGGGLAVRGAEKGVAKYGDDAFQAAGNFFNRWDDVIKASQMADDPGKLIKNFNRINEPTKKITVLGSKDYKERGAKLGGSYLDLDDHVWFALSKEQQKSLLHKWVDEALDRGDGIWTYTDPDGKLKEGFKIEKDYLDKRGYRFEKVEDHWETVKK